MTAPPETTEAAAALETPVKCVCGRLLVDPVSRARGLGPRCYKRLHGRTAPRRPADRAATHVAQQLTLNLRSQGLTEDQIRTITDVPITGSYL